VTQIALDGPQPPSGRQFCSPCIMLFKAAVVQACGAEIQELETDGQDGQKVFRMRDVVPEGTPLPRLSVGVALVNGNHQLGMVPVCWEHMIVANTATPSGLQQAHGNVEQALAANGIMTARTGQRQ
jgi:hypothetical protein